VAAAHLWQAVVVLHNEPLPLVIRLWLTRALYEHSLSPSPPSIVGPEIVVNDKDVPMVGEWCGALECDARLAAGIACRESSLLDASQLSQPLLAISQQLCGSGMSKTEEEEVRELGRANGNPPFGRAEMVLAHMVHVTSILLSVDEATTVEWRALTERHKRNRLLLSRLIMQWVIPLFVQLRLPDTAEGLLGALKNWWSSLLGLRPDRFPQQSLTAYADPPNEDREDLGEDLGRNIVVLGRALHVHSLMTLAQLRRAVAAFWPLLWQAMGPNRLPWARQTPQILVPHHILL
jgi:hypothetical protein